LRPRLFSMASIRGHQLALIVAKLRQFVCDNDLGASVDGRLCVISLNEAIPYFMMRLSGSVKLRRDLGSGSSDVGAAGLPGFLRPSACRCCSFSASMRRSSSAASLASASSAAIACWIFANRFCLSPAQSGNSSPRLSLPKVLSYALGDQTLKPHVAGSPEQVGADLALLEGCDENAVEPSREAAPDWSCADSRGGDANPRHPASGCRRRRAGPRRRAGVNAGR
jgi:hypothetical protein